MALKPNLLKIDPVPTSAQSLVAPGLALVKSVQITSPNFALGTSQNITTITVDAPDTADFNKYRAILFRFFGLGVTGGTACDITINPRKEGAVLGTTIFYQLNQITSVTATGWVSSSATGAIPMTAGTLLTNAAPIHTLDILMTPFGYNTEVTFNANTTMPIGSIAKSTGTYSLPTGILPRIELNSYPGVTIGLSAANTFSAWNINAVYAGVGITCDVYGYSKL